jgi:hypothetical protein
MKKIITPKRKAPKQKKSNKVKDWVVVVKDGNANAAIDNHVNTKDQLLKLGYTIIGCPASVNKADAIDYVEAMNDKYYGRERKK